MVAALFGAVVIVIIATWAVHWWLYSEIKSGGSAAVVASEMEAAAENLDIQAEIGESIREIIKTTVVQVKMPCCPLEGSCPRDLPPCLEFSPSPWLS